MRPRANLSARKHTGPSCGGGRENSRSEGIGTKTQAREHEGGCARCGMPQQEPLQEPLLDRAGRGR